MNLNFIKSIFLRNEAGVSYGVKHIDNKIRTSSMSYLYDIAKGNVPDHYSTRKFGTNIDVGTTEEVLWDAGGVYPYLTGAEILQVSSSSVNDTAAGTGARTVEIYGLDASYNEQSEIVTLNGTTLVPTVSSYLRVYRAIVRTAGTSGSNEGDVIIQNNAATITLAQISIGNNQSLMAVFTVPAGYTGYITGRGFSSDSNKSLECSLYIRPFGEVFQLKDRVYLFGGSLYDLFEFPIPVSEKSDIELRAESSVAGSVVSGIFNLWYEL